MKATIEIENILRNLSALRKNGSYITSREYAVFLDWLTDANGFNASSGLIARRTGIHRPDVRNALNNLVRNGILVPNGMDQDGRRKFTLSERMKVPPEIPFEAAGPVYPDGVTANKVGGVLHSQKVDKVGVMVLPERHSQKSAKSGGDGTPKGGSDVTSLTNLTNLAMLRSEKSTEKNAISEKNDRQKTNINLQEEIFNGSFSDLVRASVTEAIKTGRGKFIQNLKTTIAELVGQHGEKIKLDEIHYAINRTLSGTSSKLANAKKIAKEAATQAFEETIEKQRVGHHLVTGKFQETTASNDDSTWSDYLPDVTEEAMRNCGLVYAPPAPPDLKKDC